MRAHIMRLCLTHTGDVLRLPKAMQHSATCLYRMNGRLTYHAGLKILRCCSPMLASGYRTRTSVNASSSKLDTIKASRAKDLAAFLKNVPDVKHAFAYGSGVFHQEGLYNNIANGAERPMLDFILAVDNPTDWHNQNIAENRGHYSSLALLGGKSIVCNAERLGAGVHFNPSVPWNDQMVKYGVIGESALYRDLTDWDCLYAAGRMQKPVLSLRQDPHIEMGNRINRTSSLIASLLLLPQRFTSQDLFRTIVGLSYLGDIRMGLAEDSRKIDRIASGSADGFHEIYTPLLRERKEEAGCSGLQQLDEEYWAQDMDPDARCQLLCSLPKTVKCKLARRLDLPEDTALQDFSTAAKQIVSSERPEAMLQAAIASIVGPASRGQAAAGLFMAGPVRAALYVFQKVKKKFQA